MKSNIQSKIEKFNNDRLEEPEIILVTTRGENQPCIPNQPCQPTCAPNCVPSVGCVPPRQPPYPCPPSR